MFDWWDSIIENVSDFITYCAENVGEFFSWAGGNIRDFSSWLGDNTNHIIDPVEFFRRGGEELGDFSDWIADKTDGVIDIKAFGSWAYDGLSDLNTIARTNVKNSVKSDSIVAFGEGFLAGGLAGGIAAAAVTTTANSMKELDKSGKFNKDYAFKLSGFDSVEEQALANRHGYRTKEDFEKALKEKGFASIEVYQEFLKKQEEQKKELQEKARKEQEERDSNYLGLSNSEMEFLKKVIGLLSATLIFKAVKKWIFR